LANSNSTSDLLKGALKKAGEATDGSSRRQDLALREMNRFHKDFLAGANEFDVDVGEPWSWAREENPRTIVLKAPYETGSVSLTNASVNGTFSSAPSSTLGSFAGRFLKVEGRADYYRIATHTAGASAFTIDTAYLQETGATLSFQAIPLIYELGEGILRLCEPFRVYQPQSISDDNDGQIFGIDINTLRREFPFYRMTPSVPERFATIFRDVANAVSWKVQFSGYPLEETKVDFDCIPVPEDLYDSEESFPKIPIEHRPVLEYATAYALCMDKGDAKADHWRALTQAKLRSMLESSNKEIQQVSKQRGQLVPRADLASRRRNLFRSRFW
jgi:hypothetical protein